MQLSDAHVRWIMLVSGLMTCSMAYMALSPPAAMQTTFGTALAGPLAEIIVRNWAILIVIGGVALLAGAFRPAWRAPVLAMTGAGKLAFLLLVLAYGRDMLDHQVRIAVVADSIMVFLFAACLMAPPRP